MSWNTETPLASSWPLEALGSPGAWPVEAHPWAAVPPVWLGLEGDIPNSGIIQASSANTIKLAAAAAAVDQAYRGAQIRLADGRVKRIIDYIGSTRVATVDSAWSVSDLAASFVLPLNDMGLGRVDTTLSRGVGSPTFTRATPATTIDSTGKIISVASGVPRSYYDPTTLEYRGYLAEGARTNLMTRSEETSDASWVQGFATVAVNADVAPDGNATADKLVEDGTLNNHTQATPGWPSTPGVVYTYSMFVKAAGRSSCRLGVSSLHVAGGTDAVYDLVAGVVTGTPFHCTAGMKYYAKYGYWRLWQTFTTDVGSAGARAFFYMASTPGGVTNYTGDGSSGMLHWGFQVDVGPFPSTYIPTTTVAVARNADLLTYLVAGNVDPTKGTCYAELSTEWSVCDLSSFAVSIADVAGRLLYVPGPGTDATTIFSYDGTVAVGKTGITSMFTGARKRASSWGATGRSITGDGAAPNTGTFDGVMGGGGANLGIGCVSGGGGHWFGTFKNGRLWLSPLSDALLQSLTSSLLYEDPPVVGSTYEILDS